MGDEAQHLGNMTIPRQFVRQLLGLPDGIEVDRMHLDYQRDALVVTVRDPSGASLHKTEPGELIPEVAAAYQDDGGIRKFVGWA